MSASNYLENEILDHILGEGNKNYTAPTLYIALLTGITDGETGNVSEVAASFGYTRIGVDFADAVDGVSLNSNTPTFGPASGGNWGNVTHMGVYDALTAGNLLFYGALAVPKNITDGDTFQINPNALSISLS